MTTPDVDLADTPVVDGSEFITEATPVLPALSIPIMPPPAGLLEGEQRAADGGIEPVTTD